MMIHKGMKALTAAVVLTLLAVVFSVVLVDVVRAETLENQQCFCKEVRGQVDDCSCDVATVESLNSRIVYPFIEKILETSFFSYFKVDLNTLCPFWPDDGQCVLRDCSVSECTDESTLDWLRSCNSERDKQVCDSDNVLDGVDSRIVDNDVRDSLYARVVHDNATEFCDTMQNDVENGEWVDLHANPERYTGYVGRSPNRIWRAIYLENCFRPEAPSSGDEIMHLHDAVQDMCVEKRVFFRLISGLHTSINIHLTYEYFFSVSGKWGPNLDLFQQRFSPATTAGNGPTRLKNLHFTYLFVLRAIVKSRDIWDRYEFYTGNKQRDISTRLLVSDFVESANAIPDTFDETVMFQDIDNKEAEHLKSQVRDHFRNITRIMDCVGCDKCKLWGKIQTGGMATALKILISYQHSLEMLQLRRSEVVSLFNLLGRLSESIKALGDFRDMQEKYAGSINSKGTWTVEQQPSLPWG